MTTENRPKYIRMMADDTTLPFLFWDDEGCAIGDFESFHINEEEFLLSSLKGLEEWFLQADKYDPYEVVRPFTNEGMEEWINQGYKYAKQVRKILPNDIELCYQYWHKFGNGEWVACRAYITL